MAGRLLIIGGSGFVSGTLAQSAVAAGWEVTAVTRGVRPLPQGVSAIRVDRNDEAVFAEAILAREAEWDLVVDAICYSPVHARQDVRLFSGKTRNFVFISTDFVYDPAQRRVPQLVRGAAYAAEGYGGLKRQAEVIFESADADALPWTIFRPNHIYGPGSLPGCLPLHSRDPDLLNSIRQGRPLRLVGGGKFLQQPLFAQDLAATVLAVGGSSAARRRICNLTGPETVPSVRYYEILGEILECEIEVVPVDAAQFIRENPDKAPFCCDRVYDLAELKATGLPLPATPLATGLRVQVASE